MTQSKKPMQIAGDPMAQVYAGAAITFEKYAVVRNSAFENCTIELRDYLRILGCHLQGCTITKGHEITCIALIGNIFDGCTFEGDLLRILLGSEYCRANNIQSGPNWVSDFPTLTHKIEIA